MQNARDGIYRRLSEKAEARDHKPQKVLLAEIRKQRSFRPADLGAPSTTDLLREDRDR